jgi:hypothetical protein
MKILLRLEELTFVVLSFYLFLALDYAWWWFPLLFFVPDVSMTGYLINKKVGAITYNFIHHKALAVLLYLVGSVIQLPTMQLAGVVMLGHSSFDRALGFDLQQTKESNQ